MEINAISTAIQRKSSRKLLREMILPSGLFVGTGVVGCW